MKNKNTRTRQRNYQSLSKEHKAIRRKSWMRIIKSFVFQGPPSWRGKTAGRIWLYVVDFLQLTSYFNLFGQAASVVYSLLLAFFPILILAMYFVSIIASKQDFSPDLINTITNFLPEPVFNIIDALASNISTNSLSGFALIISILGALWAAGNGIGQIFKGLAIIYPNKEKGFVIPNRFLGSLLTLAVFLLLGAATMIMSFGRVFLTFLDNALTFIEFNWNIINLLTYGIGFLLIFLIFLLLYYLGSSKSPVRISALPGAIIASVGWISLSYIYSIYIANKANLVNLYGGLANIIILMLWLNFSVQIILAGAIINYQIAWYRIQKKDHQLILNQTLKSQLLESNPFTCLKAENLKEKKKKKRKKLLKSKAE